MRHRSHPTGHERFTRTKGYSNYWFDGLDLLNSLQEKWFGAERIGAVMGSLPKDGWLVQGNFRAVGKTNRQKRTAIALCRNQRQCRSRWV